MPNKLWMRDAFDLLAATGLRPAELRRLRWGDIEWPVIEHDTGRVVTPGRLHVRSHDGELTNVNSGLELTHFIDIKLTHPLG
jgi:integrase